MTAYDVGLHPGATWRKADFQVHTPRDPQWNGSPHLQGGSSSAEAARIAWARSFVKKCHSLGLGAVAITDHHDVVFVKYIQEAAAMEQAENPNLNLWIFPGMEVTCTDSVQCLVLFTPGTPAPTMERFFGKLKSVSLPDANSATAPQAKPCGNSLEELIEQIKDDVTLSECMIVIPNAGSNGYKTILREGFFTRFANLEVDGFYIDGPISRMKDGDLRIIRGEIKEWGTRRRALITSGDNRQHDFERLGTFGCWIRLGEPSVEAVRQAFLADEARISYENHPSAPSQTVRMLKISSSLSGPEFVVRFNEGYNAIIGGRGSGKSAILEYLRFALGRSAIDIENDEEEPSRATKMLRDTLENGYVSVILERQGVLETWTRTLEDSNRIMVEVVGQEPEYISTGLASDRFRARGFHQKQLSTIVSEERSAADQTTGIASAELVDTLHQLDQKIQRQIRDLRTALSEYIGVVEKDTALGRARSSAEDIGRRLEALRLRLAEGGLNEEQQKLLARVPTLLGVKKELEELGNGVAKQEDNTARLLSQVDNTLLPFDIPEFKELEHLHGLNKDIETARKGIQADFGSAVSKLAAIRGKISAAVTKIGNDLAGLQEVHDAALARQKQHKILVNDMSELQKQLQEQQRAVRRLESETAGLTSALDKLNEARDQLANLVSQRKVVLEEAAERTTRMSGEILLAEVVRMDRPTACVDALRRLAEGARMRDLDEVVETRIREIFSPGSDGGEKWREAGDLALEIYRAKVSSSSGQADLGGSLPEVKEMIGSIYGSSAITDNQALQVVQRIDEDKLFSILAATPEDYISFRYRDHGVYIEFEKASPGQQAAALLKLLLGQEAGTLIVDQPEDDLDNRIVVDICRQIRHTKQMRQIIFATHNPNLVVNGDADKVIALAPPSQLEIENGVADVQRVFIECDGAIETPRVRETITETMEGGRVAFELRARKYAFDA